MTPKSHNRVVIDASVAGSSGRSTQEQSRSCRLFLTTFLEETPLIAVFSDQITDEWKRHSTSVSRSFRSSLMARKRIEWVRREPDAHLLARVLQRVAKEEVIKAEKDYCLIDAARQTDHAVVSHDDNARRRYARVATQGVEELKRIAWISPTDADCLPWLRAGAKAEARFTLGAPFLDG